MKTATKILLFVELINYLPLFIYGIYAASVDGLFAWIFILIGILGCLFSGLGYIADFGDSKAFNIFAGVVNVPFFLAASIFLFITAKDKY